MQGFADRLIERAGSRAPVRVADRTLARLRVERAGEAELLVR